MPRVRSLFRPAAVVAVALSLAACEYQPTGLDAPARAPVKASAIPSQTVTGDPQGAVNTVTPSTNAANLAAGWAYVVILDEDVGQVTLQFVSTRSFYSCFEYRIDDETPASATNPNGDITDGLWAYTCVNNSSTTLPIPATSHVDVRMVFGAERDERFDWTRFYALPTDGEGPVTTDVVLAPSPVPVGGAIELTAMVDDAATGGSTITSAEYSLNGSGWTPMAPADGAFDEVAEAVMAGLTAPAEPGLYAYQACVRGIDAVGNTGASTCAELTLVVYDPSGGFVTGGGWILSPEGASRPLTTVWTQDFSVDAGGWLDDDDIAGFGRINAAGGSALAEGLARGPFSRFDGYRSAWPGTWIAEIDVYLDPEWAAGEGFDYSVAANGTDGNHQRDFIFHVGVVEDYGPIVGKALLVNGSNNADFYTNPYKLVNDNGGNYHEVTAAGWYTLQHVFRDAGGHLAVDLNLLDAGGNLLWTATRENVADAIPAEVGGNRYSWFTHIDVADGILIDDHELHLFEPSPEGRAEFGFVSRYKKGASVPDGSTQFTFQAGGLSFHSTSYEWLVVNQAGENAQFKGEGTVNGQGSYKFMLWAGDHDDGDTFRIKIWEDTGAVESVLYDNGSDQLIGGGNIVVHDGKGGKK